MSITHVPKADASIGVKKGELIVKIVWFDRTNDNAFKYTKIIIIVRSN